MVAAAGLCDGFGEPGVAAEERIFGGGEPDFESEIAIEIAPQRSRAGCPSGDWKRLGRRALREVACVAQPDTILAWYRRLIAQKFDGSRNRQYPGRPKVLPELEALVVRMARESSGWGYDRIVGALANLGHHIADQTAAGNILRRHGIAPAPKRSQTTTWRDFSAVHMSVMAGANFFTVEVLTWRGLTYYVLFFPHLESRRVSVAGITRHPDQAWMEQIARSVTQQDWGYLRSYRYVLHDRDIKFYASFRSILADGGVAAIPLPARSPNLNAFAEHWVGAVKEECLSKLILFGEGPLSRTLAEFSAHYHGERNHQGKGNHLLFPSKDPNVDGNVVNCRHRLGGLLKYYNRAA